MSEKIYNPHCTKWGNCQKRKEKPIAKEEVKE